MTLGGPAVERLGRYALLQRLAVGGMGELFLARAEPTGRLVVLKRLRPELAGDAELATRFADEARTLSRLDHPGITRVFEHGEVNGAAFITLELVDGKDLGAVIARCQERGVRVPTAMALHIGLQVLDALAYAHDALDEHGRPLNLVHRDISPPNVLLSYDGAVKLIDFGLAKSLLSEQRTQTGALLGKLLYMPPEAARRQPLDRRADLFSLAVVLHELLAGRHPLAGLAPGEVLARMAAPRFPPLAGAPGVTPALDEALQRALQVDPPKRFATAAELRAPLAACLQELAPGFGPASIASFMRSLFGEEYARERELLQSLQPKRSALAETLPPWAQSRPDAQAYVEPEPGFGEARTAHGADAYRDPARPDTVKVAPVRAGPLPEESEDGRAATEESQVRALSATPGEVYLPLPSTELDVNAPVEPEPEPKTQPAASAARPIWIAAGVMLVLALVLAGLAFIHA